MSNRTVYSTSTETARMHKTGYVGINRVAMAPKKPVEKARCYHEFCCYPALTGVTDHGPIIPGVAKYSGEWGYCFMHAPSN